MSLTLVAVVVLLLFSAGYLLYSRLLTKKLGLNDANPTPACTLSDGVDFVPAKAPFLLGQHFSAIAAAGPIVGPILAGLAYGWLPTLLWIVLGAIFIGAVHDFSSLVGSVRHKARSVAQIVEEHIGRRAYRLFLGFIWLSLIYVITAFADLTSSSFADAAYGGAVASSSMMYLGLAVLMGICLVKFRMPLKAATPLFIFLVGLSIWAGQWVPVRLPEIAGVRPILAWNVIIFAYCFIASVMPVWLLLQPRGYLGGMFLYTALFAGLVGLSIGGIQVKYPAFIGFTGQGGWPLFPMLFVTVACGACSGFHGLVSSGTTSKQIAKESDCRPIGYGGMLLEGLIALIALATVMMLSPGDPATKLGPDRIYASGLAAFVQQFGLNPQFAMAFVLLAFATFIFDTLDVATRLGRYILQELFGWQGRIGRMGATLLTLALPAWCVTVIVTDPSGKVVPAWRVFWTVFGASNQLLAALTLLGLTVWLKKTKQNFWFAAIPCLFMLAMTLWALWILFQSSRFINPVGITALLLMGLALWVGWEAMGALKGSAKRS